MLQDERYKIIMDYLRLHSIAKVPKLVQLTGVSIDTVRRDLESLENRGMLRKVHGGAVFEGDSTLRRTFDIREIKNKAEKIEVAVKVVDLLKEGQAIALNSGTTNIEVSKKIAEKFDRLTIITNSLKIIEEVAHKDNFTIILPGGVFNNEEHSIHGRQCEDAITQYNIDVAIIAINAVSLEKGLTDFRFGEVGIIKAMMKSAAKTLIAVDSNKFEKVSLINVCPIEDVDIIVTDSKISTEVLEKYKNNSISIIK